MSGDPHGHGAPKTGIIGLVDSLCGGASKIIAALALLVVSCALLTTCQGCSRHSTQSVVAAVPVERSSAFTLLAINGNKALANADGLVTETTAKAKLATENAVRGLRDNKGVSGAGMRSEPDDLAEGTPPTDWQEVLAPVPTNTEKPDADENWIRVKSYEGVAWNFLVSPDQAPFVFQCIERYTGRHITIQHSFTECDDISGYQFQSKTDQPVTVKYHFTQNHK